MNKLSYKTFTRSYFKSLVELRLNFQTLSQSNLIQFSLHCTCQKIFQYYIWSVILHVSLTYFLILVGCLFFPPTQSNLWHHSSSPQVVRVHRTVFLSHLQTVHMVSSNHWNSLNMIIWSAAKEKRHKEIVPDTVSLDEYFKDMFVFVDLCNNFKGLFPCDKCVIN